MASNNYRINQQQIYKPTSLSNTNISRFTNVNDEPLFVKKASVISNNNNNNNQKLLIKNLDDELYNNKKVSIASNNNRFSSSDQIYQKKASILSSQSRFTNNNNNDEDEEEEGEDIPIPAKRSSLYSNPRQSQSYLPQRSSSLSSSQQQVKYSSDSSGTPKKPAILYNMLNTLTFGIGLCLFIIGIVYLSLYRYEYSLTMLSIDLISGFYLAIGITLILLTTLRIVYIKKMQIQVNLALVLAIVLMAFFILLLVLGSVGLSMMNNDQFLHEARSNLETTARRYDESSTFKHETKKINYIQQRFNCCGVDSFDSWKSLHSHRNPNMPIRFIDKQNSENNFAYRDDVPDSCCIQQTPGCGKQTYTWGRDRSTVVNVRGCLSIYLRYFSNDLTFLCSLAITSGVVFFITSLALIFVYMRLKSSSEYENLRRNSRRLYN